MFAAGWKGRRVLHSCQFSFLTPLRQKASPWTGWNSKWPFPLLDITCMRAGSQDGVYFFFSQHQSCCGNLLVEIRHSFLSQWKWGETGNIPCGTIGYQRPQWPLPVGHGHESGSNRLHNRLCRGLTVAFSFTTWIKCNCAVSQPEFHLVISKLVEALWVRIKSAEEIKFTLKTLIWKCYSLSILVISKDMNLPVGRDDWSADHGFTWWVLIYVSHHS